MLSGQCSTTTIANVLPFRQARFTSHSPLKPGQALFAGEELLHGSLFEVALLGDELVQRADQRIHIAQAPPRWRVVRRLEDGRNDWIVAFEQVNSELGSASTAIMTFGIVGV